ncbi:MAG: NAD(P)H-hydrate dehydratase [Clostridiales bacterium]|nr:NAD(P)H-hydrate dehydratase [Clostridiales bacterium]
MQNILSVDNMRKSDAAAIRNSVSSKELMLRAGKAIFENVEWKEPVAIVCGSGNNAGDGYVLAMLLNEAAINCEIFLLSDKFSEDGRHYYDICAQRGISVKTFKHATSFEEYNTVVDCIFGTGFHGELPPLQKAAVTAINNSNAYVVSVDINSGLNGDSGMCEMCVRSDLTVSIGGYKPGHFLNMAKDNIKHKVNCDIGISPVESPYRLFEASDCKKALKKRKNFSNKSTYGYIALIGGSKKYSGAIRLANTAACAVRCGAGVVTVAAPESICDLIIPQILESTLYPVPDNNGEMIFNKDSIDGLIEKYKCIAIGMGIGVSDDTKEILEYILENYKGRLIIDADALTCLAQINDETIKNSDCKIIITPHNKEFSRLTGLSVEQILNNPVKAAKEYAKKYGVSVLLKGPSTIITDGKTVNIAEKGCAAMATAGSGDVLSGVIAALCGYNDDVLLAASAGAFINGCAGETASAETNEISMAASDTARAITKVISDLMHTE